MKSSPLFLMLPGLHSASDRAPADKDVDKDNAEEEEEGVDMSLSRN